MEIARSKSNPDLAALVELTHRIRTLKSDLSAMIAHGRNANSVCRLIMAAGLLDGAFEELSKAVSEHRD
jgi:Mg2+/citrate symporter